MGFTPAQVDDMSAWEFSACAQGHNKAHGGDKPTEGREMGEQHMRDLGLI